MLTTGEFYQEPMPGHTDEQITKRIRRRAIRDLEQQGYNVTIELLSEVA